MIKIGTSKGWLDHLLAVLAGALAVYGVAMSVGKPQLATFMALVVMLAGLAGFGLSLALEETPVHKADGWIFAGAVLFAVFNSRSINAILPEDGFPFALIAAVMLFAILAVGAVFAWGDGTLLFLSLPSIALFGLVGTIDTWRPGLFLFCAFLVLVSILYARVHQRAMIRRAESLGSDAKLLRRDAWRWVAGPEWAFAASGTIILFSFLGAPVVQASLEGVSGQVSANVQRQIQESARPPTGNEGPPPDAPVGTGPVRLSDRPVLRVLIDQPRHLRNQIYTVYTGRGWRRARVEWQAVEFDAPPRVLAGRRSVAVPDAADVTVAEEVRMVVRPLEAIGTTVPAPGPVIEIGDNSVAYVESPDGLLSTRGSVVQGEGEFLVRVPQSDRPDTQAVGPVSSAYYDRANIPQRVRQLADQITRGAATDLDKATAIQRYIAANVVYNTEAAAIPANADAAEHTLFESKEGYCDVFATSFVTLARSVGLPSRYVTGYLINDPRQDEEGFFTVREENQHAWSEVYFEGYGWIPFDATEGAVVSDRSGRRPEDATLLASIRDWFQDNAGLVAGVLGGIALIGGLVFLLPRAGLAPAPSTRLEVQRLQNRFQLEMERRHGHPKRFSQTIREYVAAASPSLGPTTDEAKALAGEFESALFGRADWPKESVAALAARVDAFRKALRALPKQDKPAQARPTARPATGPSTNRRSGPP